VKEVDAAMEFGEYVADLERVRRERGLGGADRGSAAGAVPENVVVLASTASTNAVARGVAVDFESEGLDLEPMLVLAFEQTAGRGRLGRTWSSPRGRGVYATLTHPYAVPALLPALPLLVGVGLCRALAPHLPGGCRLKWPNDLLVPGGGGAAGRGRKIGGILIEALVQPGDGCVAVIGFGVNHGHRREELPDGATSLWLERGAAARGAENDDGGASSATGEAGAGGGAGRARGSDGSDGTGEAGGGGAAGGGSSSSGSIGLAELVWDLVDGVERELAHVEDLAYAVAAYRALSIHQPGERLVVRTGDRDVAGIFLGFDDSGRLRLRPEQPATVATGPPASSAAAGSVDAAAADGAAAPSDNSEVVIAAGEVIEA
jgi:biotin-[acetyl-CoA-carboxylase] ligase BirA-like protein